MLAYVSLTFKIVLAFIAGWEMWIEPSVCRRIVHPKYLDGWKRSRIVYLSASMDLNSSMSFSVGAGTRKSSVVTPDIILPLSVSLKNTWIAFHVCVSMFSPMLGKSREIGVEGRY